MKAICEFIHSRHSTSHCRALWAMPTRVVGAKNQETSEADQDAEQSCRICR
jgi:hypothetical protein